MSNSARPIIGINTDLYINSKEGIEQARIDTGYFDSILAAGGLPIILPPLGKEPEIDAMLDMIDGIVLVGGEDMDPKRFGLESHAAVRPMAERRELNDRILVRRVVERRMPVLAIGLGMQQINAATGGSLFLHLPADMPKAMPHFDPSGGPHRHLGLVEPKTLLEDIYGTNELRINSMHHQAVNEVGPKMRVCAKAPDEVIEAIESTSPAWFCLAVQWHPEAETASALDQQLFECFVQAAMRAAQPVQLAAAA